MTSNDTPFAEGDDRRQRAEELLRQRERRSPEEHSPAEPERIPQLLHDLRLHQIELEMQNEELRQSQAEGEYIRELYDQAPVGYCTLDSEGIILNANLTLATLLGVARQALTGSPLSRYIFPADQDGYYLQGRTPWALGQQRHLELRLRRANADPFWARLETIAVESAGGRPVYRMVVSDVSGQKQKEAQELLAREVLEYLNRCENAPDTMRQLLLLLKKSLHIEAVAIRLHQGEDFQYLETEGFPEQFVRQESRLCTQGEDGFIRRDSLGRPVWECLCGAVVSGQTSPEYSFFTEKGSFWSNSTSDFHASPQAGKLSLRIRGTCNREGYESVALIPLWTGQEIAGLLQLNDRRRNCFSPERIRFFEGLGASIGIALARMQTAKALRESEALNRTILENMPQNLFFKDRHFHYLSVNKAYANILGRTPEEFVGKDDFSFHPPELARKYREDDREVMETGVVKEFEETFQAGDKKSTVRTVKVPVRNDEGEVTGLLGIFEDISERKQAEEEKERLQSQLHQAMKMEAIGTLAGGIAHDFNNNLAAIMGYADMVRDGVAPGSPFAHYLDRVLAAAHRAKELIKQILAFSRQSTEVNRIPMQIQPIVKETLKMLRASLPTTIAIREEIEPRAGVVLADPTQLHQLLMNLCTNAFQAMALTGGVLTVAVRATALDSLPGHPLKPGEYLELTVSDTGGGIGPEVIAKIFDPYFTTKEVGKGTGMGLAIAHGIVESYDGAIAVESALGQGTTFHVYLPKITGETQDHPEPLEAPGGEGRILFVDDEEFLTEMIPAMLEKLGYTVTARTNSGEALDLFENDPGQFDLVITDQTMPGLTGVELARRMLRIRPELPVILCTGFSNLVDEETAKAAGIAALAMKPLTKAAIAQLVKKVLAGKD